MNKPEPANAGGPRERAAEIYRRLRREHPHAHIELNYSTPWELLVATILSAQCTDKRVNHVTASLFQKYRTPADYLRVSVTELEGDIRSTGFFRRKAEHLQQIARSIIEQFHGEVPRDMEALTRLPGVGRKTANVVLGNAFGLPGVVVDTHVSRGARRLGLTRSTDPVKIERDLAALYPRTEWIPLSHTLVFHGRYLCRARKPECGRCPVIDWCTNGAGTVP